MSSNFSLGFKTYIKKIVIELVSNANTKYLSFAHLISLPLFNY